MPSLPSAGSRPKAQANAASRETVVGKVPEPGADDRAGREGQLDALHVLTRQRLARAQGRLRLLAGGDVGEQHRDLPAAGRLDAMRGDLQVTAVRRELALEPDGLTGAQHVAVDPEPALGSLVGDNVAQRPPYRVVDSEMVREGAIGLDMHVVAEGSARPVQESDDAEALVDAVEQGPVAFLADRERVAGLALLGDVACHSGPERTVGRTGRGRSRPCGRSTAARRCRDDGCGIRRPGADRPPDGSPPSRRGVRPRGSPVPRTPLQGSSPARAARRAAELRGRRENVVGHVDGEQADAAAACACRSRASDSASACPARC